MTSTQARVQIRPASYRDRSGFLIVGRDAQGRACRIFATTRATAEHIRAKVRKGEQINAEDFTPRA